MARVAALIADRIKSQITTDPSGCWLWQGARNRQGYGVMTVGSRSDGTRRNVPVYRAAYIEYVGPIPEGLQIDHLCRVRACCNPDHLEPVTAAENRRRIPPKERCPHGHSLTGDNVEFNSRGARQCVTCRRRRARVSERKRAARLRALKAG